MADSEFFKSFYLAEAIQTALLSEFHSFYDKNLPQIAHNCKILRFYPIFLLHSILICSQYYPNDTLITIVVQRFWLNMEGY